MSSPRSTSSTAYPLIGAALAVPVLSQLIGPSLFENHWNLIHWQILPLWYKLVWTVLAVVLVAASWKYADRAGVLISSRSRTIASLLALFGLFVIFQFDSFLFSGGNLRVAQIAQAERIVFRWYEFGATGFVSIPYQIFKLFGIQVNTASVYAWKVYAFLCTALTFAGAAYLAKTVTDNPARRVWTFLIVIFGSHTFALLGLVAVEPILPAASVWLLAVANRYYQSRNMRLLLVLWGIVIVATIFFIGNVILIPVALAITIIRPGRTNFRTPAILSIVLTFAGAALAMWLARKYPAIAAQLLSFGEKRPFTDYRLISMRHAGDVLQMRIVLSSLIVAAIILWLGFIRFKSNFLITGAFLLSIPVLIASVILDPLNSPPLDLPSLMAYLLPLSVVAAGVLLWLSERANDTRLLSTSAITAFLSILAVAPSFVRLEYAEPFVTAYFDQQPKYYRVGGIALRDAYYYRRDFDKANYWDQKLPVLSDDYLNYRGCLDLSATGNAGSAANVLARMVAANPYWTEPRSLLAICDIQLGRPSMAKPHIDTCLMLEPYKKEHQLNLYRYYMALGNRAEAARYIESVRQFFPYSGDVLSEVMMTWMADGRGSAADSLADIIMARDSMLALPYLAKGRIAEARADTAAALRYYESFMTWGKYRPEAPSIGRRIYELRKQGSTEQP